jgi:hypothetical protein
MYSYIALLTKPQNEQNEYTFAFISMCSKFECGNFFELPYTKGGAIKKYFQYNSNNSI